MLKRLGDAVWKRLEDAIETFVTMEACRVRFVDSGQPGTRVDKRGPPLFTLVDRGRYCDIRKDTPCDIIENHKRAMGVARGSAQLQVSMPFNFPYLFSILAGKTTCVVSEFRKSPTSV